MLTIQVLIENNLSPIACQSEEAQQKGPQPEGPRALIAEHGLSFWIEKNGHGLIFDTGKSGAFVGNAKQLGIDLAAAETLVVSHGHYDHGGGLRTLVETAHYRGQLWTGPGFFNPKWSNESPRPRYLGLDVDKTYLESRGIQCRELETPTPGSIQEILPGIFILGNFIRTHIDETIASRFTVERPRRGLPVADDYHQQADDFADEICIVLDMPQGLVVLLGCAHPGLMNMLDTAQQVFHKNLYAIFGGSHLVEADENRILATRTYLKQSSASLIALGHCTGPNAFAVLRQDLPALEPLYTGAQFHLE